MSFGAEMRFQTTEPEPRERLGGPALTTGCFWASSLPVPLSLQLPWHPHPYNGLVGLGAQVHFWWGRGPRALAIPASVPRPPWSPLPLHRVCPPQIAGRPPGHEEMDFLCVPPRGGIGPKLKAAHGSHTSEWEEGSGAGWKSSLERGAGRRGGGGGGRRGGRVGFGRSGGGLREPVATKKKYDFSVMVGSLTSPTPLKQQKL